METEVTTADLCYAAGLDDAVTEMTTGKSVYTGPSGELTMEETLSYFDGHTWAYNNRDWVL